jgi:hypothetical protein
VNLRREFTKSDASMRAVMMRGNLIRPRKSLDLRGRKWGTRRYPFPTGYDL